MNIDPTSLFNNLTDQKLPPIESWDPPFCGDINISINRDGQWSYEGSVFTRLPLVKLFAKVLKKEGNDYYLVTPVEKVRITVEAEPFITKNLELNNTDNPEIAFMTTLDDIVIADKEHPIKVIEKNGFPYPTILIRNNLHALISRSDFYQLVEISTSVPTSNDGNSALSNCIVKSRGCSFSLGQY
ncbi:MAG: hypothetical protein ACI9N9_001650 [Enterobacterales bacterium]|jgi:hypothetical protein